MRRIERRREPSSLAEFRADNPDADWDAVPAHVVAEVDAVLHDQQRGFCAYCEGNLGELPRPTFEYSVEHFHPKHKTSCADSRTSANWNLDWENLFGVCRGGQTRPAAPGAPGVSSTGLHCDRSKGGSDLCAQILDPALMSPGAHFQFQSDGTIEPGPNLSASNRSRAKLAIVYLNLNDPTLRRRRARIMSVFREQVITTAELHSALGVGPSAFDRAVQEVSEIAIDPATRIEFRSAVESELGLA